MMTFGSLFAGIGGLDLGLERAGITCKWQVEIDPYCRKVLAKHWPDVERFEDVRERNDYARVSVIVGGDPCPVRSLAKGSLRSRHPDLSGYFLAVVGRFRPRWVVRENVPAPDVQDFTACLDAIGYRSVVVELDGADFTAQDRRRQFCVGCLEEDGLGALLVTREHLSSGTAHEQEKQTIPCLTAHPNRPGQDPYCYEDGRGLRLLDCEEAEAFMGFPRGWTCGFSRTRRRIMLGNAIIPGKGEWIGQRIIEANETEDQL